MGWEVVFKDVLMSLALDVPTTVADGDDRGTRKERYIELISAQMDTEKQVQIHPVYSSQSAQSSWADGAEKTLYL